MLNNSISHNNSKWSLSYHLIDCKGGVLFHWHQKALKWNNSMCCNNFLAQGSSSLPSVQLTNTVQTRHHKFKCLWVLAYNINEEASRCETKEATEPTAHFRVPFLKGTATVQPKPMVIQKCGSGVVRSCQSSRKVANLNSFIKYPILKMFCWANIISP